MLRTIEAIIDADGRVRLSEPVRLKRSYRALDTILEQAETDKEMNVAETALLSEQALSEDWNRKEEDEAWSHLEQDR